MNPALLKALIISGGTIGLGAPGIYYSYPHIYKLINPGAEEDQKSSEKPETTKLTKDKMEITQQESPVNVPKAPEQEESSSPSNVGDNTAPTNFQTTENAGQDTPSKVGKGSSGSEQVVNNNNARDGAGNPSQDTTENDSQRNRSQ